MELMELTELTELIMLMVLMVLTYESGLQLKQILNSSWFNNNMYC